MHPKKSVDRARGQLCRAEAYLASHVDRLQAWRTLDREQREQCLSKLICIRNASPRDLPCTGKVFLDCSQCHQFRDRRRLGREKDGVRVPRFGLSAAKAKLMGGNYFSKIRHPVFE